jgi:hypothetical protein
MKQKEKSADVQGKQNMFCYFLVGALVLVRLGYRGGPACNGDAAYRVIERDVDRNAADFAVTGA